MWKWLAVVAALIVAGIGCTGPRFGELHRAVDLTQVDRVTIIGGASVPERKASATEAAEIVGWFNAGTGARRSSDNAGHTTTAGAVFIYMKSGDRIGLWPEGTDFLVSQGKDYYYLRQPDLKALLSRLDRSPAVAQPAVQPPFALQVYAFRKDPPNRSEWLEGATVVLEGAGITSKVGWGGKTDPIEVPVQDKTRFPNRILVSMPGYKTCQVEFGGIVFPDTGTWYAHDRFDPLPVFVYLPEGEGEAVGDACYGGRTQPQTPGPDK